MRVIAGRFRSRQIKSLPGLDVRPTPDRMRESLFSILAPRIEGAFFIDAYAGTGAVGIEALSRGASRVVFIERKDAAVATIRENLTALGAGSRAQVVKGAVTMVLPRYHADIVFLDPPYPQEREYKACLEHLGEFPPKLVIVQHASRFDLSPEWGHLIRSRTLKQGDNTLSFYVPWQEPSKDQAEDRAEEPDPDTATAKLFQD